MGTRRKETEMVHQCENDWRISLAVGQGKGVRMRQGRTLELDEGSTDVIRTLVG